MDTIFRDDMPIYITTDDNAAIGYYSTELQCWCHLVRRNGVVERFTGPLGTELQPRVEPFPDEPVGW